MNKTTMGLAIGLLLGIVWAFGSFGDFILTIVIGVIGLVIGMILEGRINVSDYIPSSKK